MWNVRTMSKVKKGSLTIWLLDCFVEVLRTIWYIVHLSAICTGLWAVPVLLRKTDLNLAPSGSLTCSILRWRKGFNAIEIWDHHRLQTILLFESSFHGSHHTDVFKLPWTGKDQPWGIPGFTADGCCNLTPCKCIFPRMKQTSSGIYICMLHIALYSDNPA